MANLQKVVVAPTMTQMDLPASTDNHTNKDNEVETPKADHQKILVDGGDEDAKDVSEQSGECYHPPLATTAAPPQKEITVYIESNLSDPLEGVPVMV